MVSGSLAPGRGPNIYIYMNEEIFYLFVGPCICPLGALAAIKPG